MSSIIHSPAETVSALETVSAINTGLWRWPKVHALTGLSRSTVDRLEKAGKFPKRVRTSPNTVAWRGNELQVWVDSGEVR